MQYDLLRTAIPLSDKCTRGAYIYIYIERERERQANGMIRGSAPLLKNSHQELPLQEVVLEVVALGGSDVLDTLRIEYMLEALSTHMGRKRARERERERVCRHHS